MFILGHLGTAAAPGALAVARRGGNDDWSRKASGMAWILAGSLLPDLVDKPLGQVFLKLYFKNGRIYCHTALFALLVLAAGIHRRLREGDDRLLFLAAGVASHLVFDKIWKEPETLLWPARGPFMRQQSIKPLLQQIADSMRDPWFWTGEAIGLGLLVRSLRSLGARRPKEMGALLLAGLSFSLASQGAGD